MPHDGRFAGDSVLVIRNMSMDNGQRCEILLFLQFVCIMHTDIQYWFKISHLCPLSMDMFLITKTLSPAKRPS